VSAQPRGRSLLAGALTAAADWLVEPAVPREAGHAPRPLVERPVIAVVGLGARCGTTTVARALGAELASRDTGGACAVTAGTSAGAGVPLGLPPAGRLARTLAPLAPGGTRACGRLCLVRGGDSTELAEAARHLAPLVLDVDDSAQAAAAVALADGCVLVASPEGEPALARVVAESLERVGPAPVVVLNRAPAADGRWEESAQLALPESRMGAQMAMAGREPRGVLGRAVATLADRWSADP
jgi:hypothetical protein